MRDKFLQYNLINCSLTNMKKFKDISEVNSDILLLENDMHNI